MKKIHAKLQKNLQSKLKGSQIEKRFPEIGRIGDLCWRRMVFEIQCSPISLQEAQERLSDYAQAGVKVIFLLDDRRYNRRTLCHAENFLRSRGAYYFRPIGDDFLIYDQWEQLKGRRRLVKSPPMAVDLSRPKGRGFTGDIHDRKEEVTRFAQRISQKSSLFQRLKNHYLLWLDRQVIKASHDNSTWQ